MVLMDYTAWFSWTILHGSHGLYCMVLMDYTAWFSWTILHGSHGLYCMVLMDYTAWFSWTILHSSSSVRTFLFVLSSEVVMGQGQSTPNESDWTGML